MMWKYQCKVDRVVDGDTLDLSVDCGFYVVRKIRVRIKGVDTAEVYGVRHDSDEYEQGKEHSRFVRQWCDEPGEWPFIVETETTGKYGRWIAVLGRRSDGANLAEDLISEYPEVKDD